MSTHNILFLDIKKENHPKLFQICNNGIFVQRDPRTSSAGKGGGLWGYYGRRVY